MNINKIFLNKTFETQEEVFRFLSEEMKALGIVEDENVYLQAVHHREQESTTGLINGFAIPHGKSAQIKDTAVIYIRNDIGIEWNSLDGSFITDIFALAIPETAAQQHLDTLIAISTKLMDDSICEQLRSYDDEVKISAIFE